MSGSSPTAHHLATSGNALLQSSAYQSVPLSRSAPHSSTTGATAFAGTTSRQLPYFPALSPGNVHTSPRPAASYTPTAGEIRSGPHGLVRPAVVSSAGGFPQPAFSSVGQRSAATTTLQSPDRPAVAKFSTHSGQPATTGGGHSLHALSPQPGVRGARQPLPELPVLRGTIHFSNSDEGGYEGSSRSAGAAYQTGDPLYRSRDHTTTQDHQAPGAHNGSSSLLNSVLLTSSIGSSGYPPSPQRGAVGGSDFNPRTTTSSRYPTKHTVGGREQTTASGVFDSVRWSKGGGGKMQNNKLGGGGGRRGVATNSTAGGKGTVSGRVDTVGVNGESLMVDDGGPPFASGDDFEVMVGDLRRTFIGWLKKTEGELSRERETLIRKREEVEEERERAMGELERTKRKEMEKISEERRLAQSEITAATKQIAVEREDARRRINEEKGKFDQEKEQSRRKILMEREKFRQEYELFEAERRRIVDSAIATETMADINVGGVVFQSARHTLTQQPGSFLEALFSGRHKVARDRQGRIFLDRDAELFRTILNFLREPTNPPVPRDQAESEAVTREAEFYGIRFFPFPLVFACGGHNGAEHLRAVEVLDVAGQCWRPCRPMETERAYCAGSVLQSQLFVYGGQNLDYKALCDVEVYDGLRDVWFSGAPLNVARRNTCGTVLGDRIYAIGGFDGSTILSAVEALDPRMKGWTEVAPLTTPRSSAMCATYGDNLYVLGGTRGERLRTVEMYDPRVNKWTQLESADMIEVRSAGSACSIGSDLFALGGTDSAHNIHSSVESYNPDLGLWTFRKSMRSGRMDACCATISDSLIVTGGQDGKVLDSTEFYRAELDEWQPGPSMLFPRYGHVMMLVNL